MRKMFLSPYFTIFTLFAIGFALLASPTVGRAQNPAAPTEESLDSFIQKFLGSSTLEGDYKKRYFSASIDLKDDGTHEVIVYVLDPGFCGSGGCTTLLLAPENSSYRIVTKFTIVQLPIRMLATKSNGWHDLGVGLRGGGIQPGYEVKLSFNGKTYPRNPSMYPVRRLTRNVAGKVVISSEMVEKLVKKDSVPIRDGNHPEK